MSKNTGFSITSAERYSLALYELSEESNLLNQIEDQSSSVLNLINQSNEFSHLIKDSTIKQEDLTPAYTENQNCPCGCKRPFKSIKLAELTDTYKKNLKRKEKNQLKYLNHCQRKNQRDHPLN